MGNFRIEGLQQVFEAGLTEYVDYPVHLARLKWIWETIQRHHPQDRIVRILDIGCGTGNITIPLGTIPSSEVFGIDIHNPTLDIARQRNPLPNVEFRYLQLEACNLSKFDILIMTEVLEHIAHYHQILAYLGRNMRPDALFLLTIPNGWGPFEISQTPVYILRRLGLDAWVSRVKQWVDKVEPYSQNYDTPHVNFFTRSRITRELRHQGLEIREIHNAFVFLPIIETYLPALKVPQAMIRFDTNLARYLPGALVSGWYFLVGPIRT